MSVLYSPSKHAAGLGSGFYFAEDPNAPADSFLVSDKDHGTAVGQTGGFTYSFTPPVAPATEGTLTLIPPVPSSIADLNSAAGNKQISMLKAAYSSAIAVPVQFTNAAGVTSTYPTTAISINGQSYIQNLQQCVGAGSSAWTLGVWEDSTGVMQTFTFADLQGLAAAIEAVDAPDWKDLFTKITLVQSLMTSTTVDNTAAIQAISF